LLEKSQFFAGNGMKNTIIEKKVTFKKIIVLIDKYGLPQF
jgi:hypothetical protein